MGPGAADIKAKCAKLSPAGAASKNALKHTPQNFPTRVKERFRGSPEISKACAADIKENCPGKERSCILKSIGNAKDQCKEALAQAVAGKQ